MKSIIVIPTYNEKETLAPLVGALFTLGVTGLEVIVVDDSSPDGTDDEVEKLRKTHPIYLIRRQRKLGLGSAYISGFKKALALGADYIFEMDADFSHDPNDVPRLLQAAEQGADLVIGSRRVIGGKIKGWNWRRHLTSYAATILARWLLKLKTRDVTAGFRCFRRRVLEHINLDAITSNGYAFQEELLYRTEQAGFRVAEIPVTFTDRRQGKSKLSNKDVWEFFLTMWRLKKGRRCDAQRKALI